MSRKSGEYGITDLSVGESFLHLDPMPADQMEILLRAMDELFPEPNTQQTTAESRDRSARAPENGRLRLGASARIFSGINLRRQRQRQRQA